MSRLRSFCSLVHSEYGLLIGSYRLGKRRCGYKRTRPPSEVKADFGRLRARRHVMRAAEGGKEIVERDFVR